MWEQQDYQWGIFPPILCSNDKNQPVWGELRVLLELLELAPLNSQPHPCEFPVGSKVLESPWAPWLITAMKDHKVSLKYYLSRWQQNVLSLGFCSQHVELLDCKGSGEAVAICSLLSPWKIRAFSSWEMPSSPEELLVGSAVKWFQDLLQEK